jgi:hypothetical protein
MTNLQKLRTMKFFIFFGVGERNGSIGVIKRQNERNAQTQRSIVLQNQKKLKRRNSSNSAMKWRAIIV